MFLSQLGRADDNASGVGAEWEVLGTAGQNMSYKNAKRSKAAHKLRATHPGPPPATPPNALMDDGDIDESRRYDDNVNADIETGKLLRVLRQFCLFPRSSDFPFPNSHSLIIF